MRRGWVGDSPHKYIYELCAELNNNYYLFLYLRSCLITHLQHYTSTFSSYYETNSLSRFIVHTRLLVHLGTLRLQHAISSLDKWFISFVLPVLKIVLDQFNVKIRFDLTSSSDWVGHKLGFRARAVSLFKKCRFKIGLEI